MKKTLVAGAAMLGLAGLLGGGDGDGKWIKDKCVLKDNIVLEAEYVSRTMAKDGCNLYITIQEGDIYLSSMGSITRVDESYPNFTCGDGRVFDKNECSFVYAPGAKKE